MILCILEFTDRKILTLLMSDDGLNAEASEMVLNLQCTDCGGLLRSLFLPLPGETPCTLPCSHPAVLIIESYLAAHMHIGSEQWCELGWFGLLP